MSPEMPQPEPEKREFVNPETQPSQESLRDLITLAESHEVVPEPFDDIPEGLKMEDQANMTEYTVPPDWGKTTAPMAILKTPEGKILQVSFFRNPQNRALTMMAITVLDSSKAAETGLRHEEHYSVAHDPSGKLAISKETYLAPVNISEEGPDVDPDLEAQLGLDAADPADVAALAEELKTAKPFNIFS